jgi:hypothetical protein
MYEVGTLVIYRYKFRCHSESWGAKLEPKDKSLCRIKSKEFLSTLNGVRGNTYLISFEDDDDDFYFVVHESELKALPCKVESTRFSSGLGI